MKLVEKTVNKNEFTEFINHCTATAKRLETRGNLDAAAEWRKSAARTYRFTGDMGKSREQYSFAAGIYEKIATINEKEGYIGYAAFHMEKAGELYNDLLNKDKAKECYSRAIALSEQNLKERKRSDPNYIDTCERDNITRLMRRTEDVNKI